MEYFSTGVTRDKLMVLHGLKALGMQPTKEQLSDFFGIYDLLGYFAVQNAAYELEEEGLISAVPRPYGQAYFVTPQGEQTLDMFAVRLPGRDEGAPVWLAVDISQMAWVSVPQKGL